MPLFLQIAMHNDYLGIRAMLLVPSYYNKEQLSQ